jgi:hypothetical protein
MTSERYSCTRCGLIRIARRPGLCQSCLTSEAMQATKGDVPATPDWTGRRCYSTNDNGHILDPWFPTCAPGKSSSSIDWATPRKECMKCPILDACGKWALGDSDPTNGEGMWGGMTPDERAQYRATKTPSRPLSTARPNNPTTDARCGTYAGTKAHRERREQFCDGCRRAKNDYENGRKRRQRAALREEAS